MEHEAALAEAVLGVLKAGKFYVPLDPADPVARSTAVLERAEAPLIITSRALGALAATLADGRRAVLTLEEVEEATRSDNPALGVLPDSFAYVIFTSGTTGQPKGVVDTHRNVLHNVMRYTDAYQITADDRLTLFQRISNSGSVSSLFGALLNGASIFPFDVRGGLSTLSRWLTDRRISIYHSVPTIFRHMLREGDRLPSVRLIRLEGDRTLRSDVDLYRKHFGPSCVLAIGLGITECGLICRYKIDRTITLEEGPVPVGFAVSDMEVEIRDERGGAVGPHIVGEIAVRSRYLAHGYWRSPELTDAAFGRDVSGARVYRTGDLGRMRADGALEYLGRNDSRVKIRGNNVELVEVEDALLSLEGVHEAAVTTAESYDGEQRLAAFVVPSRAAAPTVEMLRAGLGALLPDYMAPSSFRLVERLPLSPNGKIDRSALPAVSFDRPSLATPYSPPRSPLESLLADLWASVLNFERVGVDDPFLALGGDSLLATQLVARVNAAVGIELPPMALLRASTVADQATTLLRLLLDRTGSTQIDRWIVEL